MKILEDTRVLVASGWPSLEYALGCATAQGALELDRRDWPPHRIVRVALGTEETTPRILALRAAVKRLCLVHGTDWHNLSKDAQHDVNAFRETVARQERLAQSWDGTLGAVVLASTRTECVRLLTAAIHYQPPKVVLAPVCAPEKPVFTPSRWESAGQYEPDEDDDGYSRPVDDVP